MIFLIGSLADCPFLGRCFRHELFNFNLDLLNGRDCNCNLSHNLCEEILKKLKNFKAKRNYNFDSAWMTYLDLQQRLPELMLV